jgi:hypothetical protein
MRIDRIYISLTCGDRIAGGAAAALQELVDGNGDVTALKALKPF